MCFQLQSLQAPLNHLRALPTIYRVMIELSFHIYACHCHLLELDHL